MDFYTYTHSTPASQPTPAERESERESEQPVPHGTFRLPEEQANPYPFSEFEFERLYAYRNAVRAGFYAG